MSLCGAEIVMFDNIGSNAKHKPYLVIYYLITANLVDKKAPALIGRSLITSQPFPWALARDKLQFLERCSAPSSRGYDVNNSESHRLLHVVTRLVCAEM